MLIKIKKVQLLRRRLQNRPGSLAESLKPFAEAGVNLQVIMGYVYEKDRHHAELEVFGAGNRAASAGRGKFETARHVHCVIVEGDDRTGLGYEITRALGSSRINMSFAIMQAVGRRYSGVFGFETDAAATRAIRVIKSASAVRGAMRAGRATRSKTSAVRKGAARKSAHRRTRRATR